MTNVFAEMNSFLMPDRELDALVAEKVMGWKWGTIAKVSCLFPPELYQSVVSDHPVLWEEGRAGRPDYEAVQIQYGGYIVPVPNYSTASEDALNVVDKLRQEYNVTVFYRHSRAICVIESRDGTGELANVAHRNTARAICLAALQVTL